jgi:hypothetical protein
MINLGATRNFISRTYIAQIKTTINQKTKLYTLTLADSSPIKQGSINQETK